MTGVSAPFSDDRAAPNRMPNSSTGNTCWLAMALTMLPGTRSVMNCTQSTLNPALAGTLPVAVSAAPIPGWKIAFITSPTRNAVPVAI